MTKKYRWIFGILITICMSIILILISSIALDYHRNIWRYLGGPVSDGIVPQKVIEWLLIVTPVWTICGWWLNNQFSLVQMTVFRYGNIGVWWKQQIKEVYLLHSWYYILMLEILSIYASAQKWFSPKYCPFVWGMYNASNQTYPNKGYDIEKAIVLSVVFIIVLNAAIFVDKKLLKRSLSHGKNRTDRSE